MSDDDLDDGSLFEVDRVTTIGCFVLLACFVSACLLSQIFRPSDLSAMRACAEACGPGRMARYSTTSCECIDLP